MKEKIVDATWSDKRCLLHRHIRLIDLISAKGKTKVSCLISFHSLIRQCFNILLRHSNLSRIRNIKIERSKQLYHNDTLPLFSPLPKLGQWMWRQLTERMLHSSKQWRMEEMEIPHKNMEWWNDGRLKNGMAVHSATLVDYNYIDFTWCEHFSFHAKNLCQLPYEFWIIIFLQFLTKYSYYRETLGIFQQKPTGHDENLVSIVTFMAQVIVALFYNSAFIFLFLCHYFLS